MSFKLIKLLYVSLLTLTRHLFIVSPSSDAKVGDGAGGCRATAGASVISHGHGHCGQTGGDPGGSQP